MRSTGSTVPARVPAPSTSASTPWTGTWVPGRADDVALASGTADDLRPVAGGGGSVRRRPPGLRRRSRGETVASGLTGRDGLLVLLACLRVGATLVFDDSTYVAMPGGAAVRRDAQGDELDWDVVLRAGRTTLRPAPRYLPARRIVVDGRRIGTGAADRARRQAVRRPRHAAGRRHGHTGSMSEPRRVAVLGSTGSIGTQALDVIRANPDRFRVVALTAGGGNRDLFDAQVAEWSPGFHGLGEDA